MRDYLPGFRCTMRALPIKIHLLKRTKYDTLWYFQPILARDTTNVNIFYLVSFRNETPRRQRARFN